MIISPLDMTTLPTIPGYYWLRWIPDNLDLIGINDWEICELVGFDCWYMMGSEIPYNNEEILSIFDCISDVFTIETMIKKALGKE